MRSEAFMLNKDSANRVESSARALKKRKLKAARRINHAITGANLFEESVIDKPDIDIQELKLWREIIYQEMFALDAIDPQGTLFRYFKKRGEDCCGYSFDENKQRIIEKRSYLLISNEQKRRECKDNPIVLSINEQQFQTKKDESDADEYERF